jgi:hypothetical protein
MTATVAENPLITALRDQRDAAQADLEQLKQPANDLLTDRRATALHALQRIREFLPGFSGMTDPDIRTAAFTVSDAYLTIAREYGFASWARLNKYVTQRQRAELDVPHHERIRDPVFRRAVDLLDDGDVEGLGRHLSDHPGLVHQRVHFDGENYFRDPTLLEFVAENPVRHDSLPPTIVSVARTILEAGARTDRPAIESTLSLVASGRVPREAGVQVLLIDLLCDYGATPQRAMRAALGHAEFQAVDGLIRRGAHVDLPAAAATGRLDEARAALPHAAPEDRHLAMAWAAQYGRVEILRLLLDAGEDPDRYNPPGAHSHSTPLHQAALAGHHGVVELLVERGARTDIRDIHHRGTPLDWAQHGRRDTIVAYLRQRKRKS